MQYAILQHPGHNRVYFDAALTLAPEEARNFLVSQNASTGTFVHFSATSDLFHVKHIAGIPYLIFESEPLTGAQKRDIARLSFFYALFELDGDMLRPIECSPDYAFGDDLITIPKYNGKTNELFTRLLVNAAIVGRNSDALCIRVPNSANASCAPFDLLSESSRRGIRLDSGNERQLRLLDPVAGRGTTLLEAAMRGFDAYGTEVGDKPANDGYHYFKKYLETARVKHRTHTERVGGNVGAKRRTITYNDECVFELCAADSARADGLYKRGFFDLLVGDLPYGVNHANVTNERGALARSPRELLRDCLPVWRRLLAKDGGGALAWNLRTLPREEMVSLLTSNGFEVFDTAFEHRVDASIQRDVVVFR